MYSHIIVPFDGEEASRRAAGVGADLSQVFDNRLVVVTATPGDSGSNMQSLKDRAQAMSDEKVDVWIEPHHKPVEAIVTTTKFRPRSMICMSTHARQGMRRAVFGSVAEAVVAQVDVPVIMLGPKFPGGDITSIRQLIICVDGSATSQSILPLAAQWAQFLDLPCTLLYVEPNAADATHRAPDLGLLASLLERSCPRVEVARQKSRDVTGGILDHLTESSKALAVMATHGRMGTGRSNGSQVMKVVERCPVPVLVERANAKRPVPVGTAGEAQPTEVS